MFKAVKQNRAYQDVVEQIQDAIISGTLKPGSQLPAERELKESFGISRGTLREALRVLEQKGLIEIRTGVSGGSIVREVNSEQLSENLGLLIRNRTVSLRDLAEFRKGIEGGVAVLAAQRANEQDKAALRALLAEAEGYLKQGRRGWDAFIRTDEKLHMALASISANQLFISVLESVYLNIHTYYENFLPREKRVLQENFDDLSGIVAAVEAGDGERARELAQGHVDRFNAYMEEKGPR
ncbi:FadR/GntR family transcriptional regulator [Geobacter sp. SVR]|uniref:FadR/GntR family transcriptional regulator n=1 Tax=Geobacter sp. SVR TaxID=2495594 RepID=UPI00143EFFA2|nr:FadR/GntR family transcriptional regulator [Geobacter sp. SVR]BCS52825.1 GntR family transcriptional regulator [Geobacter sp. SVR]GCF86691.1 GntR family transcriptional regulator [Geobacter sp. SVR]